MGLRLLPFLVLAVEARTHESLFGDDSCPTAEDTLLLRQSLLQGRSHLGRKAVPPGSISENASLAAAGKAAAKAARKLAAASKEARSAVWQEPDKTMVGGKLKKIGQNIEDMLNDPAKRMTDRRSYFSGENMSIIFCISLFFISFCCLCWAGPSNQFHWDAKIEEKELEVRKNTLLDEDTYGLAVSVLVRDSAVIAMGEGKSYLRQVRFLLVFLLVFVNMGLQAFLLFQVCHLVTPEVITNLRKYYDKYEWHMYGQNVSHFVLASDGKRRGLPEFFRPELFATLDIKTKKEVCHVPFSQPKFFMVVLFVWTLTALGEFRKTWHMFRALILHTPTVETFEETLKDAVLEDERKVNEKILIGITRPMKVFITSIVLLPRTALTSVLLWLGSRWLAGTTDFGDLIMNTVALEFILLLQNLLFMAAVPARNKRDLRHIEVLPPTDQEVPGLGVFTGSFAWLLAGVAWVVLYTYRFQRVLPDYNWDVRDVCSTWLNPPS